MHNKNAPFPTCFMSEPKNMNPTIREVSACKPIFLSYLNSYIRAPRPRSTGTSTTGSSTFLQFTNHFGPKALTYPKTLSLSTESGRLGIQRLFCHVLGLGSSAIPPCAVARDLLKGASWSYPVSSTKAAGKHC